MAASFHNAGLVVRDGLRVVTRWLRHSSWPWARKLVALVLVEALAISTTASAAQRNFSGHDDPATELASSAKRNSTPQSQASDGGPSAPQLKLASLVKSNKNNRSGPRARPLVQTSNAGLAVSVGFADSSSPSSNFPLPWQAAPNIVFLGVGSTFRAGAIRLDNTSGADIAVDKVIVNLGRPGPAFQLWSNFTV